MDHFFITGTSKGLGKALAEKILDRGNAKVIGISRGKSIIHPDYHHISLDLSDLDKLQQSLDEIFPVVNSSGKIVLINNAGTLGTVNYLGNLDPTVLRDAIALNFTAPALLINQFIGRYKNNPGKKAVINISSGAGKKPVDGWSLYCSTKSALDMITAVADVEHKFSHSDIRFFAVAPGIVDTGMQDEIRKTDQKQFSRVEEFINYKKEHMLISPEKVADKLLYIIDKQDEMHEVVLSVRDITV